MIILPPEIIYKIFFLICDLGPRGATSLYNYKLAMQTSLMYKDILHTKKVYHTLWNSQSHVLFNWLSRCNYKTLPITNYPLFCNLGSMYFMYYKMLYNTLFSFVRVKTIITNGHHIVQLYMINGQYIHSHITPTFILDSSRCKVNLTFTLGSILPLFKYFNRHSKINVHNLDKFFKHCDSLLDTSVAQ